jgi:hypothetical protein
LKDDPDAIKRADAACKKYHTKQHLHGGGSLRNCTASDCNQPTNASKCQFINYKDMTPGQKQKMHKDVLAATATSSTATTTTTTSPATRPTVFFMASIPVLSAPPACCILPVPVQAGFPHLTIQLGLTLGCSNGPAIQCVINTTTALTTGNFHFFAQIAKAYPHTVTAIFSHVNYSPIVLSSIIQQNGKSVTTDLTVAFQFHMPYLTREGAPSTLLVATGPHVTVNTILGLPFISKPT